jgi:Domain of unknown function (DUF4145)
MANKALTFIVDCHRCRAKVAAAESGRVEWSAYDDEAGQPYATRVYVGLCPVCGSILAGESDQLYFEGVDSDEDRWSDVVRVYPKPPKTFLSPRIPRVVTDSLREADRSLQSGANIAACVMFGRALEALCRDNLKDKIAPNKHVMLGEGIQALRDNNIIDGRLFDWSQQLQAFRNLAAHPEDVAISRDDAEDLQTFVYAIVEYVYDLSDRYNEFKERAEARAKKIEKAKKKV